MQRKTFFSFGWRGQNQRLLSRLKSELIEQIRKKIAYRLARTNNIDGWAKMPIAGEKHSTFNRLTLKIFVFFFFSFGRKRKIIFLISTWMILCRRNHISFPLLGATVEWGWMARGSCSGSSQTQYHFPLIFSPRLLFFGHVLRAALLQGDFIRFKHMYWSESSLVLLLLFSRFLLSYYFDSRQQAG